MTNPRAITQDLVRERLQAAIAMRVGRDRQYTPEMVEKATGIVARTVKAYRSEGIDPSLTAFLRMVAEFGPEFANEILEIAGVTGCEPVEAADLDGHALLAESAHTTAEIADVMVDGKITHDERPKMLRVGERLVRMGKRIKSALRRPA